MASHKFAPRATDAPWNRYRSYDYASREAASRSDREFWLWVYSDKGEVASLSRQAALDEADAAEFSEYQMNNRDLVASIERVTVAGRFANKGKYGAGIAKRVAANRTKRMKTQEASCQ